MIPAGNHCLQGTDSSIINALKTNVKVIFNLKKKCFEQHDHVLRVHSIENIFQY